MSILTPTTPTISLPAEVVFHIGGFAITNAVLTAFSITVILGLFALLASRRFSLVPTRIQVALEFLLTFMYEQVEQAFPTKKQARQFFPFLMTLFLFLMIANQFSLVPLAAQLTAHGTAVFRTPTSVLSGTIALSLMVVIMTQVLAFMSAPLGYIGNYIRIAPLFKARSLGDVLNAFLEMFLGVLDLIGQLANIVSLGARLFGNIFAGEVMIAVIASLAFATQFIVPIPFIILSIFSGAIQAFVFALLATQFIGASVPAPKETPEFATAN